jgi:hypothetical protein
MGLEAPAGVGCERTGRVFSSAAPGPTLHRHATTNGATVLTPEQVRLLAYAYARRHDEDDSDLWWSPDDLTAAHRCWEQDWLDRRWHDGDPVFRISDRGMTAVRLAAMHAAAAANLN